MLAVEKQTGKTPKALETKPVLHQWLVWVYEAFWMLDSARPVHQGSVGRIPLSEMRAYLELFGPYEIESRQLFVMMMNRLDSVYLPLVNERIARKVEQQRKDAEREAERKQGDDNGGKRR